MNVFFCSGGQRRHWYCLERLCEAFPDWDIYHFIDTRPFPWRERFCDYAAKYWYNPLRSIPLNPYLHIPYREKEINAFEDRLWGELRSMHLTHNYILDGPQFPVQFALQYYRPEILISYGTQKLRKEMYEGVRHTINLHGGCLPFYRGMDTNLWAIWKNEWQRVGVTLHGLAEKLDAGPIYSFRSLQEPYTFVALRSKIATLATDRLIAHLKECGQYGLNGWNDGYTPAIVDPYYRPMPAILKLFCDIKISNRDFSH